MFEQIFTTQNIIQGGSVIISIYLIYSHMIKDKAITKLMSNHLEHDLEQREKDNQSRDKLTSTLQSLINIIKTLKKK